MTSKKLEILFEGVELCQTGWNTSHLISISLIYPRFGIAKRECDKTIELQSGASDWSGLSWTKRLLFKETVDNRFGIQVELSESLTKSKLKAMGRYVFGGALRLAGSMVGDVLPVGGDYAELPFQYYGKNLQKAVTDADIWLTGDIDVSVEDIPPVLEIPLVADRDITKTTRKQLPGGRDGRAVAKTVVLVKKGAKVGVVRLHLKADS